MGHGEDGKVSGRPGDKRRTWRAVPQSHSDDASSNPGVHHAVDDDDAEVHLGFGASNPGVRDGDDDDAEVHLGLRSSFPLSFGKQEKKITSLEAIHLTTKRPEVTAKQESRIVPSGLDGTPLEFVGPPRPHENDEQPEAIDPSFPRQLNPNFQGDYEESMVGPPLPSRVYGFSAGGTDDESEDDEEGDQLQVPLSNEILLKGPTKVASALAVDPTGSRVLTGSYDFTVRMYDFEGMNAQLRSFRQLEPSEGHQVRALSWSPSADQFIAITGSAQAKIYDRDGFTLGEFLKGDMYIRDLKNTKGHISGLTAGQWHPRDRAKALTSSEDGSLRIWDVTDFKSQKQVIKPKLARPGRVSVTSCCWGMGGNCLAGGLADGSVQVWNVKAGWGSRPDIFIEKAHEGGDDVTGMCFSADGFTLLSRSTDSTLKVWDLRQSKKAMKVFEDLNNSYAQTSVSFSPDESLILTGTSVVKGGKSGGLLVFFDKTRLELTRKVGLSATQSVVYSSWHPRLNQIFVTSGNKTEGITRVLYDPAISERGALVCVSRAPRKKSAEDFEVKPVIHTPHALPMFREDSSRKRQREKAQLDPIKSRRPDLPVTGPGFGGRIGTTKGSLLTQYLMKEGGMIKETWMDEDPREAILKHAEAAAKDPDFFGPAYAKTQPQPIFVESDNEEEE